MYNITNIYCDESCHLLNDGQKIMALGAISCPADKKGEIFNRIREIKKKYDLTPRHNKNKNDNRRYYEIKWNKISNNKLIFYKEIIDFFFDDDDLSFRVLIVPDKASLDYAAFNHTNDTFYYKMYFSMLKLILNPNKGHNIYIDIKDTRSKEKVHKLEEVLRNDKYDYSKK